MEQQIDPVSALDDAILQLRKVADKYDLNDIRELVAEVLSQCLQPVKESLEAAELKGRIIPVLEPIAARVRVPNIPEWERAQ